MEDMIFKRVSVRRFQAGAVEDAKIEKLLRAAMAAPSAGNQQPWEFYVITDGETLTALSKASPYAGCTAGAPLAIVPCWRRNGLMFPECAALDLSAAVENILLEAVNQGLGGVWLALSPMEDRVAAATKVLDLPEDLIPFCIIPIGYPEKEAPQKDRFDESRLHWVR